MGDQGSSSSSHTIASGGNDRSGTKDSLSGGAAARDHLSAAVGAGYYRRGGDNSGGGYSRSSDSFRDSEWTGARGGLSDARADDRRGGADRTTPPSGLSGSGSPATVHHRISVREPGGVGSSGYRRDDFDRDGDKYGGGLSNQTGQYSSEAKNSPSSHYRDVSSSNPNRRIPSSVSQPSSYMNSASDIGRGGGGGYDVPGRGFASRRPSDGRSGYWASSRDRDTGHPSGKFPGSFEVGRGGYESRGDPRGEWSSGPGRGGIDTRESDPRSASFPEDSSGKYGPDGARDGVRSYPDDGLGRGGDGRVSASTAAMGRGDSRIPLDSSRGRGPYDHRSYSGHGAYDGGRSFDGRERARISDPPRGYGAPGPPSFYDGYRPPHSPRASYRGPPPRYYGAGDTRRISPPSLISYASKDSSHPYHQSDRRSTFMHSSHHHYPPTSDLSYKDAGRSSNDNRPMSPTGSRTPPSPQRQSTASLWQTASSTLKRRRESEYGSSMAFDPAAPDFISEQQAASPPDGPAKRRKSGIDYLNDSIIKTEALTPETSESKIGTFADSGRDGSSSGAVAAEAELEEEEEELDVDIEEVDGSSLEMIDVNEEAEDIMDHEAPNVKLSFSKPQIRSTIITTSAGTARRNRLTAEGLAALCKKILQENRQQARANAVRYVQELRFHTPAGMPIRARRHPEDYEFFEENRRRHGVFRPALIQFIATRKRRLFEKKIALQEQFSELHEAWKKRDEADAVGSADKDSGDKKGNRGKKKKSIDGSMDGFRGPQLLTGRDGVGAAAASSSTGASSANPNSLGGMTGGFTDYGWGHRSSRRGTIGVYASDTVKSEAEWQEVLAMIAATETTAEREVHLARLCADEPDMILDPVERHIFSLRSGTLVADPVAQLDADNANIDLKWSQRDRELFRIFIVQYGKNFPRIAKELGTKSTQDCVQYYYRVKYDSGLKSMIRRGHRGGYRRKPTAAISSSAAHSIASAGPSLAPAPSRKPSAKPAATKSILGREAAESRNNAGHDDNEDEDGPFSEARKSVGKNPSVSIEDSAHGKSRPSRKQKEGGGGPASAEVPAEAAGQTAGAAPTSATVSGGESSMLSTKWTMPEKSKALMAISKYGQDFAAIAQAVKTKTAEDCREFFEVYNRKLRIDPSAEDGGGAAAGPSHHGDNQKKKKKAKGVKSDHDRRAANEKKRRKTGDSAGEADEGGSNDEMDQNMDAGTADKEEAQEYDPEKKTKRKAKKKPTDADALFVETPAHDGQQQQHSAARTAGAGSPPQSVRKTVSYWSRAEKEEFVRAIQMYGKDWESVSRLIGSKSSIQVRNHYVSNRDRLRYDEMIVAAGHPLTDEDPTMIANVDEEEHDGDGVGKLDQSEEYRQPAYHGSDGRRGSSMAILLNSDPDDGGRGPPPTSAGGVYVQMPPPGSKSPPSMVRREENLAYLRPTPIIYGAVPTVSTSPYHPIYAANREQIPVHHHHHYSHPQEYSPNPYYVPPPQAGVYARGPAVYSAVTVAAAPPPVTTRPGVGGSGGGGTSPIRHGTMAAPQPQPQMMVGPYIRVDQNPYAQPQPPPPPPQIMKHQQQQHAPQHHHHHQHQHQHPPPPQQQHLVQSTYRDPYAPQIPYAAIDQGRQQQQQASPYHQQLLPQPHYGAAYAIQQQQQQQEHPQHPPQPQHPTSQHGLPLPSPHQHTPPPPPMQVQVQVQTQPVYQQQLPPPPVQPQPQHQQHPQEGAGAGGDLSRSGSPATSTGMHSHPVSAQASESPSSSSSSAQPPPLRLTLPSVRNLISSAEEGGLNQ